MINEWIFCAIQVSVIAMVAYGLGQFFLNRAPETTASIGAGGMCIAALIVVATACGIPRPWTLEWKNVHTATASPRTDSPASTVAAQSELNHVHSTNEPGTGGLFGVSLADLAKRIRQMASVTLENRSSSIRWIGRVAFVMIVLLVIRFAIGIVALFRLNRDSRPVVGQPAVELVRSIAERMNFQKPVQLRIHESISSPCVSWLSPRTIFLPASFDEWSVEEESAGLAHEIAHLQRRDPLFRLVSELSWTLNCWHPLVFGLRRQMTLAQELAADQMAARGLGDERRYSRGLSLLAFRFDEACRRKKYFLGVSFSSSCLIRRIKMLKGFQASSSPGTTWLRKFVAGVVLAGCGWVGCWNVQAQSTESRVQVHGQEGVRVAAAIVEPEKPTAPFSRPASTPWITMGGQSGYVNIRIAETLRHPLLEDRLDLINAALDAALLPTGDGIAQKSSDFGFSLDRISSLDATVTLWLESIPHEERDESGATRKIGFGINGSNTGLTLRSETEVDWSGLMTAVDFEGCFGKILGAQLRNGLKEKSSPSHELCFVLASESDSNSPQQPPTDRQQRMWGHVNGGVVTVFANVSSSGIENADLAEDDDPNMEIGRAFEAVWVQVNSIAVGLDFVENADGEFLRLAIEPTSGVTADGLSKQLHDLIEMAVSQLNSESCEQPLGADDRILLEQLGSMKLSVVGSGDDSHVMLSGPISISRLVDGF